MANDDTGNHIECNCRTEQVEDGMQQDMTDNGNGNEGHKK